MMVIISNSAPPSQGYDVGIDVGTGNLLGRLTPSVWRLGGPVQS